MPLQQLDEIISQPMPHDINAEISVLGGALGYKEAMPIVVSTIKSENFHKTEHRHIFDAMVYLFEHGDAVDTLTVSRRLKDLNQIDAIGGDWYLTELVHKTPSAVNIEHHCRIVKKLASKRRMIGVAYEMIKAGMDSQQDVMDALRTFLPNLFELQSEKKAQWGTLAEYALKALENLEQAKATKREFLGIPTGFQEIDEMTGGMQKSELIVIGGRPSMGKTAYMMSCAQNAAAAGYYPAIFSLEMAAIALALRVLSGKSRINSHAFRALKYLTIDHLKTLAMTLQKNINVWEKIFINETGRLTPMDIMALLKQLIAPQPQMQEKLIVFVDYTQIIYGGKDFGSRNDEVSFISSFLKVIAKTFECPVVAFSQLSRAVDQRGGDHRPILSDLRDSGGIEQDADVVQFLYRDDYYDAASDKSIAEVIIAKQRNGPVGIAKLYFAKEFTEFRNLTNQDSTNGSGQFHSTGGGREPEADREPYPF